MCGYEDSTLIVLEGNVLPRHALLLILLLLRLEHELVELLVELLVGIVDAELLETVYLEDFKAVNVQHLPQSGAESFNNEKKMIIYRYVICGSAGGVSRQTLIQSKHKVVEELRVKALHFRLTSSLMKVFNKEFRKRSVDQQWK